MRFSLIQTVILAGLGIGAALIPAGAQQSELRAYDSRYDHHANGSTRRAASSSSETVQRTVVKRATVQKTRVVPRQVERTRTRVTYRHAVSRPVRAVRLPRTVVAADKPAEAVFYYDNTLVGRDPDANIRLMLLRDNVRTMWSR